eukprot:Hpha_TRINITY_DN15835_c0_g1::TRINITY_DN15835_c0_g1_i1::g.188758::m.188758
MAGCCQSDEYSRWAALRSQTQAEWVAADAALREENVRNADPPYPPRLASWPPYDLQAAAVRRPRLFPESRRTSGHIPYQRQRVRSGVPGPAGLRERRMTTPEPGAPGTQHRKPPDEDWTKGVLADWLSRMYSDVKAPLEPLFAVLRRIIAADEAMTEGKRYATSLNLPALKEELLRATHASLPEPMAETYADAVRRLGDWYEQRNPFRRLLCDSWVWWWHTPPDLILPWNLECFVEQASPCCAAASAAGAINSVMKWPRPSYCDALGSSAADAGAPGGLALCAQDALRVMETELFSMAYKSIAAAGVDLHDHALEGLVTQVAMELEPGGQLYSPPPSTTAQKVKCMHHVRSLLLELLPSQREALNRLNLAVGSDAQRKGCRHLHSLIANIWGIGKMRCSRPSTARFGSWGVVMAVEQLSLKGRARGLAAAVQSAGDFTWSEFCALVVRSDCAVVLHLPNHYACVFAVRGDAILTARKGQPPTDWVSWEELRNLQKERAGGVLIVVHHQHSVPPLKTTSVCPLRPTPRPRATAAARSSTNPSVPPKRQPPVTPLRNAPSSATASEAPAPPPPSGPPRQLEPVPASSSSGAREWKVVIQGTPVWADSDGEGVLLAELDEGHTVTELERTRHCIRHAGGWTRIRAREEEADGEEPPALPHFARRLKVSRAGLRTSSAAVATPAAAEGRS